MFSMIVQVCYLAAAKYHWAMQILPLSPAQQLGRFPAKQSPCPSVPCPCWPLQGKGVCAFRRQNRHCPKKLLSGFQSGVCIPLFPSCQESRVCFVRCRYWGDRGNLCAGFGEVRAWPRAQAAVASSLRPATSSAAARPTGTDWRHNLTCQACMPAAAL